LFSPYPLYQDYLEGFSGEILNTACVSLGNRWSKVGSRGRTIINYEQLLMQCHIPIYRVINFKIPSRERITQENMMWEDAFHQSIGVHASPEEHHQLSISSQQTLRHSLCWQAVSETVAVRAPKGTWMEPCWISRFPQWKITSKLHLNHNPTVIHNQIIQP
jgi:hypothetical protein